MNDITQIAAIVGNDWVEGSYYDIAEPCMDAQWDHLIWPLISSSNFSTTLELAPGHGRNTAKLLAHAQRLHAIDINQTNVDFLKRRSAGIGNLDIVKNSGADLAGISSDSITFLYCFDAMVHFDSDVVRSYIKEFRRVMKPGARAFIHYSAYDKNPTGSYRDHPGWRNFMSPALFHHWLAKEGFAILSSHYIAGASAICDNPEGADAITCFELPVNAEPSRLEAPKNLEAANHQLEERIRELEARLVALSNSGRSD